MRCETVDSPVATANYCRQVRKIRASFARQPLLRHHALSDLAKKRDAELRPSPIQSRIERTSVRRLPPTAAISALNRNIDRYLPTDLGTGKSAVEHGFADHVAQRLRNGGFTYSDRIHLIDTAEKIGIPRFRANLILAIEQNRSGVHPANGPAAASSGISYLLVILAIEIVAVGLFVWMC